MTNLEVLYYVDHTLLKPTASWEQIKNLCKEAIEYNTASICIPPSYVKRVCNKFNNEINVGTVIGFPLGYSTTFIKEKECEQALSEGAEEFDVVINIGDVKSNNYDKVEKEISLLKKTVGNKILKVIVETCYLDRKEKIDLCHIVTNAGADYIKTSTGFGSGGADIEDIRLFKNNIGSNVKIKAAGGIKSLRDMEVFINEGCSRIGTSSAINLVKGEIAKDY